MSFFFSGKTKEDILKNVHTALFHAMKAWPVNVKLLNPCLEGQEGEYMMIKLSGGDLTIHKEAVMYLDYWCFSKHTGQTHNTLYSFMSSESHLSGSVWNVSKPSSLPLWTSVVQLGWCILVRASKNNSHDPFSQ